MSKLIITTVGTSVITNKLYDSMFNTEITQLTEMGTIPRQKEKIVETTVATILNNLKNNHPNKFLSAELASLRAFKNQKELGIFEDDVIAFFSTDTEDGKFCAEVNQKILESLGWCQVQPYAVIEGLKTKRTEEGEDISKMFKDAGLGKLKKETENLLQNSSYEEKYFNITGGFKATIPFVAILAFEKGMSLYYLYEESNDLIMIESPSEFICSFEEMLKVTRIRREILA